MQIPTKHSGLNLSVNFSKIMLVTKVNVSNLWVFQWDVVGAGFLAFAFSVAFACSPTSVIEFAESFRSCRIQFQIVKHLEVGVEHDRWGVAVELEIVASTPTLFLFSKNDTCYVIPIFAWILKNTTSVLYVINFSLSSLTITEDISDFYRHKLIYDTRL